MDKHSIDKNWHVLQDVHDSGEKLQIYNPEWDAAKNMGAGISEWEPIDELIHLQLIYSRKPYFGRELRYFNNAPWWYKNEFTVHEGNAGKEATLRFENVDYFGKVWLNGHYLGEHEGYFAPFEFEVGNILSYAGPNTLIVKVWSPWDTELLPLTQDGIDISNSGRTFTVLKNMVKGTYEHADTCIQRDVNPVGMYGNVTLEWDKGLRLNGAPAINATLNNELNESDINILVPLIAAADGMAIDYKCSILNDPSGIEQVIITGNTLLSRGKASLEINTRLTDPKLWNSWDRGDANLYTAIVEIFSDNECICSFKQKFGIRKIELIRNANETLFKLNDNKIYLRGTNYLPEIYLSSMTPERYARDLLAMKNAGCNAVRVHVHVARPDFYDLCDEMGMLVIQDSEFTWEHPMTEEFTARGVKVFGDMVTLLRNHPSIICWICLNEPDLWKLFKERGIIILEQDPDSLMELSPGPQLVELLKKLDPQRPYIKGSFCQDDPESGDCHNYTGSLTGEHTHYTDIYGQTYKLNTEFGFDAPGNEDSLQKMPELYKRIKPLFDDRVLINSIREYQYRYLKYVMEYHRIIKYNPCSGFFQFCFTDICPQNFNGVYDWWGDPKEALKAFDESCQPVGVFMEHKDEPVAVWVVNDYLKPMGKCSVEWSFCDDSGKEVYQGKKKLAIGGDCAVKVSALEFEIDRTQKYFVTFIVKGENGEIIKKNQYADPFNHPLHPKGHPNRMSHELGVRLYGI